MLETSYDSIIQKHAGLVRSLAFSFPHCGIDPEDLMQEGYLGLIAAVRHYREGHTAKFSTYAVFWIRKSILQAIDREFRHRQIIRETATELAALTPQQPASLAETRHPDLASLLQNLPELERKVLTLSRGQGLPLKDISNILGISVERVRQTRQKAIRRLHAISGISIPAQPAELALQPPR